MKINAWGMGLTEQIKEDINVKGSNTVW